LALIEITIINSPENVSISDSNSRHTFTEGGGTLGRGPDNNWVLDDPDNYVSANHARVTYENDHYTLFDLSQNGTFVNGSRHALGKGEKFDLKEGDKFMISDYEFVVNIRNDSIDRSELKIKPRRFHIPRNWINDVDPVIKSDPTPPNIEKNSIEHYIEALSKLENERLVLENKNEALMSEVARLAQIIKKNKIASEVVSEKSTRAPSLQDETLFEAMGLSKWNLDDTQKMAISGVAGVVVRETLEGLLLITESIREFKREFRVQLTTINPVGNNPLKHSANLDGALKKLFIEENEGFKEPVEAVRESFQGIADQQMAVYAGMQAAFNSMVDRFDPKSLENRFEKYKNTGLLQLGQNGNNWKSYKKYHAELAGNIDYSFKRVFGDDFVKAYENQIRQLVSARESKKI